QVHKYLAHPLLLLGVVVMEIRPQGERGKIMANPKDIALSATEKARNAAERAGEAASTLGQRAKDTASSVGQSAADMASRVGQKAQDATSAVGGRMESLAGTIREKAPHEGMMGTATSAVADTLESGGRYLQEEGLRGLGADMYELIRRNPIPALLVGIALGFFIARATRR